MTKRKPANALTTEGALRRLFPKEVRRELRAQARQEGRAQMNAQPPVVEERERLQQLVDRILLEIKEHRENKNVWEPADRVLHRRVRSLILDGH